MGDVVSFKVDGGYTELLGHGHVIMDDLNKQRIEIRNEISPIRRLAAMIMWERNGMEFVSQPSSYSVAIDFVVGLLKPSEQEMEDDELIGAQFYVTENHGERNECGVPGASREWDEMMDIFFRPKPPDNIKGTGLVNWVSDMHRQFDIWKEFFDAIIEITYSLDQGAVTYESHKDNPGLIKLQ